MTDKTQPQKRHFTVTEYTPNQGGQKVLDWIKREIDGLPIDALIELPRPETADPVRCDQSPTGRK